MLVKTKLQLVKVNKICPKCSSGYLVSDGDIGVSKEGYFPMICEHCKGKYWSKTLYPYDEYQELGSYQTESLDTEVINR